MCLVATISVLFVGSKISI